MNRSKRQFVIDLTVSGRGPIDTEDVQQLVDMIKHEINIRRLPAFDSSQVTFTNDDRPGIRFRPTGLAGKEQFLALLDSIAFPENLDLESFDIVERYVWVGENSIVRAAKR